ncbi:MAG: PIN domain-containing protein [Chloroflexota bacterium]
MTSRPDRLRPRVFIDADALFAGSASPTGASHLILQLGELRIIDLFASVQVRIEVERNLAAKLPAALPAFRAIAAAACQPAAEPDPVAVQSLRASGEADPSDAAILAAALASGCRWLVTFNTRDYRAGEALTVATPGEFMRQLREQLLALA